MKIVLFGNCQAGHLRGLLSTTMVASNINISYFSNNARTGNRKPDCEIVAAISDCDVLIYQALSSAHGQLSDENIKKTISQDCISISFPYIFNSGISSLCHAPMAGTKSHGHVFGEEIIINQIESGKSKERIIHDYKIGDIDFNVLSRFNESISQMKQRELSTDIKLTEFILQNYKNEKLFLTHNHPANILFYEMIRQIYAILALPLMNSDLMNILSAPSLKQTNCPISPYDVEAHGYKFGNDEDWMVKGVSLIELIVNSHVDNV